MDAKRSIVYLLGSFLLAFLGTLPSIEGKHGALWATNKSASRTHVDLLRSNGDPCLPRITGQHFNQYCLESVDAGHLPSPTAESACSNISSLTYQERYFDLAGQAVGFNGYFAPSNWTATKNLGDGGVDVTGAPNDLLVEGANTSLISVTPAGRLAIQIAIPAEGMITFDWSKIGGSNLFPADFAVRVNERRVPVARRATGQGVFRTPFLHPGDQFALEFRPQAQNEPFHLKLANFSFLTAAIGVVERTWTATDDQGRQGTFRQFISIERPSLTDVIFPENRDGIAAPLLEEGNPMAPASTGFPVIDRDGDLSTSYDQYRLDGDDAPCGIEVSWNDEILTLSDQCVLLRHWVITDRFGNNTMKETQVIKFMRTSGPAGCPEEDLLRWPRPATPAARHPEVSKRVSGANGNNIELESEYTTL